MGSIPPEDGPAVTWQRTESCNIGMVLQDYALFAILFLAENVVFGLKIKGVPLAKRDTRVLHRRRLIGLPDFGRPISFHLSAGQQQRVALALAIWFVPGLMRQRLP